MIAPLLLAPGTLCDERVFGPMLARLGPDAASAPPIAHATVEEAADAMLAAAPPRFVAGGFSLGGFVVLEVMRRAPERLAGAVLIASHALPPPPGQADARRGEVTLARAAGMEAVIDALWPRYVAAARRDDAGLRRLVVDMAEAVGATLFARQVELAVTRPDSRDTVRDAAVPLLVLCGAEDGMCPPERCGAATGPRTTIQTLPKVGHFLPLEAPDACTAAVQAWMRTPAPCC